MDGQQARRRRGRLLMPAVALLAALGGTATAERALPHGSPPNVVDPHAVVVDAGASGTPIDPDIYGACGSEGPELAVFREIRLPLCRWGGDATSRYDWQVNASNAGADWFFLGGAFDGNPAPGAAVDQRIDGAARIGAKALVTVPIGPFVQKGGPGACAFSVRKYGADQVGGGDRLQVDANGNGPGDCTTGTTPGGTPFTGNDPSDTSVPNTPELQAAWVRHLVARYGPSSRSGIVYELDNEPSNWAFIHRDVVRARPAYAEIISRGQQFAAAIKAADPTALVAGPSDLPFAWDPGQGGRANMVTYLRAMKAYQDAHGVRLLDVFTVHYPDAGDDHWPELTGVDAVRAVVDATYPGTGIGVDEWNLTPKGGPLVETLATATQLGIFARDGVSLAAYWGMGDASKHAGGPPAFRIYRDYDGAGGAFGESFLASANPFPGLSVFAARRGSDDAVTIVVVNAGDAAVTAPVRLSRRTVDGAAQVYRYGTGSSAITRAGDVRPDAGGRLVTTFPQSSVTMLVVH